MTIVIYTDIWVFDCFLSLVFISIFLPVQCDLCFYNYIIQINTCYDNPSNIILLCNNVLTIWSVSYVFYWLWFYLIWRILQDFWLWVALNLLIDFGKMIILSFLILLNHVSKSLKALLLDDKLHVISGSWNMEN